MRSSRTTALVFRAHVAAVIITTAVVVVLTLAYMRVELTSLRGLLLLIFLVVYSLSNLLGGLALKRIGYSPWLGLAGFAMGLVPLILYLALPEKRQAGG